MENKIYVNKYDFIGYYTKQPSLWFLPNSIVDTVLQTQIYTYKHNKNFLDELDDEEEIEEIEIDSYEYYKEQLFNNLDVDNKNPKIQEGIIIDKKSREFIINKFNDNHIVIDLEEKYADHKRDNEFLANKTKELLIKNKNVILFQSVFIHDNKITKPDGIVKTNDEIILIETKATTSAKLHHALDVYFQAQVLNNIDYLNDYLLNYRICLVAYKKANKFEVPLIISDNFNYTKTISIPKLVKEMIEQQKIQYKQAIKKGDGLIFDKGEVINEAPISFDSICNGSLEDLVNKLDLVKNAQSKKSIEKAIDLFTMIFNSFNNVVNELENKKKIFTKNIKPKINNNEYIQLEIKPHYNDKSDFKNNDNWLILKKLYQLQGYQLFNYSGNIVNQTNKYLVDLPKEIEFSKYAKKDDYIDLFNYSYMVNENKTKILLDKLKPKKVYFDFETINTAIRPLDNCLPFMQIVTQCSIIIDDNTIDVKDIKCDNLLYDPQKISINDFKEIVDKLYMGSDYSYVVYNKNFESNRLKEFIEFIDDSEYTQKINVIINNLFDLADFFNIVSKDGYSLFINELGGYYSIKKVLPLIEKYKIDIYDLTGCKDYNSLDIGNGLVAQNETTLRFIDRNYDDKKWEEVDRNLRIYCENDVRAMIAVEYFVKWIFDEYKNKKHHA